MELNNKGNETRYKYFGANSAAATAQSTAFTYPSMRSPEQLTKARPTPSTEKQYALNSITIVSQISFHSYCWDKIQAQYRISKRSIKSISNIAFLAIAPFNRQPAA